MGVIFLTVGTQLAFDRLVRAVDEWAGCRGRSDVFGQVGPARYKPTHIEWARFISPNEFRQRFESARAIVAHAGMGSILSALELSKPIIVMPRRAKLREHRNDHQVATAQRLREIGKVVVAFDELELAQRLDELDRLTTAKRISPYASPELLAAVSGFINGQAPARDDVAASPPRRSRQ